MSSDPEVPHHQVQPTQYGIRGHRVMTPDEAELSWRLAEATLPSPAALATWAAELGTPASGERGSHL